MHDVVFRGKCPMTGLRKDDSIKHFLVGAKVDNRNTKKYENARCNIKLLQICESIQDTDKFEDADCDKYKTWKNNFGLRYRF